MGPDLKKIEQLCVKVKDAYRKSLKKGKKEYKKAEVLVKKIDEDTAKQVILSEAVDYVYLKIDAAEHISDTAFLNEAFAHNPSLVTVDNISKGRSQAVYKAVIADDFVKEEVVKAALEKLDDQMWLAKCYSEKTSASYVRGVRIEMICQYITDRRAIEYAARNASKGNDTAAKEKLELLEVDDICNAIPINFNELTGAYKNTDATSVREKIIAIMTAECRDDAELEHFCGTISRFDAFKAVGIVRAVSDETVKERIALSNYDSVLRNEAVRGIGDKQILQNVFVKSRDLGVCKEVLEKITDETMLRSMLSCIYDPEKYSMVGSKIAETRKIARDIQTVNCERITSETRAEWEAAAAALIEVAKSNPEAIAGVWEALKTKIDLAYVQDYTAVSSGDDAYYQPSYYYKFELVFPDNPFR